MRNALDGRSWAWLLGGLLLLVPLSALAEDLFPDKNLEAAVRKYVFSKKQTAEPLVEEDVRDLSTIVAKGQGDSGSHRHRKVPQSRAAGSGR